ncbi:MAG: hypothetical protein IJC46_03230 [Clostridia bacterium]|nr:hypothetical protein [Clostridia bacterium]
MRQPRRRDRRRGLPCLEHDGFGDCRSERPPKTESAEYPLSRKAALLRSLP